MFSVLKYPCRLNISSDVEFSKIKKCVHFMMQNKMRVHLLQKFWGYSPTF